MLTCAPFPCNSIEFAHPPVLSDGDFLGKESSILVQQLDVSAWEGVLYRQEVASEYTISGTLGSGMSATVYRAAHSETGKETAVKIFDDNNSHGIQAATAAFEFAVSAVGDFAIEHYSLALMNGHPAIFMELGETSLHDWIQVLITELPRTER